MLLNGGPEFTFDEAVSFQIATDDQEETDRYWNAIVSNGGEESVCGWCKDRFGLSWQITPKRLTQLMAERDPAKSKAAFEVMMQMRKIDIAALDRASKASPPMRKLTGAVFQSVDGVMQAPGGPEEDRTGRVHARRLVVRVLGHKHGATVRSDHRG